MELNEQIKIRRAQIVTNARLDMLPLFFLRNSSAPFSDFEIEVVFNGWLLLLLLCAAE